MALNKTNQQFEDFLEYLRTSRRLDLTGYKRPTLMRRVTKRMGEVNVKSFTDYLNYLESNSNEFVPLFNSILINVTSFFRDPPAWEFLQDNVLPEMVEAKHGSNLRVLCAGCASGEEAYTIAMLLAEMVGAESLQYRVKIYATDADEDALGHARHAGYSPHDLQAVPQQMREKYFTLQGTRYVVSGDLRRAVIFGRHDLAKAPPISHLDLLICRNTLMYFNAEVQSRILARFHFALNDTGFLFLGKAEMLFSHPNLFVPVNLKHRVFSKVPKPNLKDRWSIMNQSGSGGQAHPAAQQEHVRERALDFIPQGIVLVDPAGRVILINEHARQTFDLGKRDVGKPIQDLEISYKPVELRSRIEQAYRDKKAVEIKNVGRVLSEGHKRYMDILIFPMTGSDGGATGVCISFQDVTEQHALEEEQHRLHEELETAYEELQSTNEELETTNEELQSTNEELETTNEELQSTNEELETMNEELQSTNEELQTTNEELRIRSDELNGTNSLLESILFGMPFGALVLDRKQNVAISNQRIEDLWGLRGDEVHGNSFLGLDIPVPWEEIKPLIKAVLNGEKKMAAITVDTFNRRGKAIRCRLLFTQLTDARKEVEGVIILVEEILSG